MKLLLINSRNGTAGYVVGVVVALVLLKGMVVNDGSNGTVGRDGGMLVLLVVMVVMLLLVVMVIVTVGSDGGNNFTVGGDGNVWWQ